MQKYTLFTDYKTPGSKILFFAPISYLCVVMKLSDLTLIGFKNIASAELRFCSGVNCLVGANGAGKTNVLDALHYLSVGRGATGLTDVQSVRHGGDFFMAEGLYTSDAGRQEQVVCSYSPSSGKALKRGGKEYERLSDHLGLVPLVVVFPSDVFLVSDAAEERRRYMNSFISQLDRPYLDAIIRYNNVLSQRNRLLKEFSCPDEMLDILDMQMAAHGRQVYEKRAEVVAQMAPLVAEYYATLSGDREQVELSYRSELADGPFAELLAAHRERDRINRFSACGVHRDDLVMRIGGLPLKKYGSQGQQKSFLVALKLAQYQLVHRATDEHPILLLDDLFDKLDVQRVERLIDLVTAGDFGQIFITDCNKLRLEGILGRGGREYSLFEVVDGEITQKTL